jgi:hypothetical protein
MLATDKEILGSLTKTSANDHRKQFIGHLFNKQTNQSKLVTFYAYHKKDALEIAREYGTRFAGMQLVDLRLEK